MIYLTTWSDLTTICRGMTACGQNDPEHILQAWPPLEWFYQLILKTLTACPPTGRSISQGCKNQIQNRVRPVTEWGLKPIRHYLIRHRCETFSFFLLRREDRMSLNLFWEENNLESKYVKLFWSRDKAITPLAPGREDGRLSRRGVLELFHESEQRDGSRKGRKLWCNSEAIALCL